jgi:hypothetical protein
MSVPPDLPFWRRALALTIVMTGVFVVCAGQVGEMVNGSWMMTVGGIVGGVACAVLGGALAAQRIVCGRCGRSLLCVGGRLSNCPIRSCLRCGEPLFPPGTAARTSGKRTLLVVGTLLLLLYVGSYVALSRRGYAEADQYSMKGFYYFFPEDSETWRWKNYGCVYLFWPLNAVDRWLGFGRPPACEPFWGLSK